jgi:nucleotide-binding universal stress UspA family protein
MTHTAITRTLVVGYADRSSLPAVDWAVHEAELRSATVCVAGCYHMHVDAHAESVRAAVAEAERLEESTRRELEDVVERARRSHPRVRFECEAVPGPAHTALAAMTTHADILVLGSHHRDAPHEFWLARTARRTARHSACPLVVVRQPNTPNYLQRIVVGVDGGSASAAALAWAADEASLHGVELVVVHAWMYPYAGMGAHADHAQAVMRAAAINLLERSVSDAKVRCTTTITTELIEAGPAAALLGVVRDRDLLVVGSRGRGPLRSALFGSTVNSLLETSPVSIAVIRDPDTPI